MSHPYRRRGSLVLTTDDASVERADDGLVLAAHPSLSTDLSFRSVDDALCGGSDDDDAMVCTGAAAAVSGNIVTLLGALARSRDQGGQGIPARPVPRIGPVSKPGAQAFRNDHSDRPTRSLVLPALRLPR